MKARGLVSFCGVLLLPGAALSQTLPHQTVTITEGLGDAGDFQTTVTFLNTVDRNTFVPGSLGVLEENGQVSDIVTFVNPAGAVPHADLVSDSDTGGGLSFTGFTVDEVSGVGTYTPDPRFPGFGVFTDATTRRQFNPTYRIVSDTDPVPEPPQTASLGLGALEPVTNFEGLAGVPSVCPPASPTRATSRMTSGRSSPRT